MMMRTATNYGGQTFQILPPQDLRQMLAGTARPWIKSVRASLLGREAFNELEELRPFHPHLFRRLQYWVLFECWCATQFDQLQEQIDGHPYNKAWSSSNERARRDFPALAKDLSKARKRLESLVSTYKPYPDLLLGFALEKTLEPQAAEKITMGDFLKLIEEFENQCQRKLPVPRGWLGCLAYNKRVAGAYRRQHEAQTALEFALCLRFKHFTNAAGRHPIDITDCTMPSDGDSCYGLVANFCKATFGRSAYGTAATPKAEISNTLHVLRNTYPDIKYVGWPVQV
jgi:hypothetical protein